VKKEKNLAYLCEIGSKKIYFGILNVNLLFFGGQANIVGITIIICN
jgi:hypothetical protein